MSAREGRVQQWLEILRQLLLLGGAAERTRVVPNCLVVDSSPSGLPSGYIIVKDEGGYNVPAILPAEVTVQNGDYVNLLYIAGTEPIVLKYGSSYGYITTAHYHSQLKTPSSGSIVVWVDDSRRFYIDGAPLTGDVTYRALRLVDNFDLQVTGELSVSKGVGVGKNLQVGMFGGALIIGAGARLDCTVANRLDLASGDSLNLVSGNIQIGGTTVIDSSRNATFAGLTVATNARADSRSFSLRQTEDGGYPNASAFEFRDGSGNRVAGMLSHLQASSAYNIVEIYARGAALNRNAVSIRTVTADGTVLSSVEVLGAGPARVEVYPRLMVSGGINVGSATGAGTGQVRASGEIYARGDNRGLAARVYEPHGTPTDHFRSGSIPSGFFWTGTTPTSIDYSFLGDYLRVRPADNSECSLVKSLSGTSVIGKRIRARVIPTYYAYGGLVIYYVVGGTFYYVKYYLAQNSYTQVDRVVSYYLPGRSGTITQAVGRGDQAYVMELYHDSETNSTYFYLRNEVGDAFVPQSTGTVISSFDSARIGLYFRDPEPGGYGMVNIDWFWTDA